jgi:hypothetical protein
MNDTTDSAELLTSEILAPPTLTTTTTRDYRTCLCGAPIREAACSKPACTYDPDDTSLADPPKGKGTYTVVLTVAASRLKTT